jgi:hypothetical protein
VIPGVRRRPSFLPSYGANDPVLGAQCDGCLVAKYRQVFVRQWLVRRGSTGVLAAWRGPWVRQGTGGPVAVCRAPGGVANAYGKRCGVFRSYLNTPSTCGNWPPLDDHADLRGQQSDPAHGNGPPAAEVARRSAFSLVSGYLLSSAPAVRVGSNAGAGPRAEPTTWSRGSRRAVPGTAPGSARPRHGWAKAECHGQGIGMRRDPARRWLCGDRV